MLHTLHSMLAPAVMERVVLVLNHVLAAEPAATARLAAHAGRVIDVKLEGWPSLLPPAPALAFAVTPAGLLDWLGLEAPASSDLRVFVEASNPAALVARALAGEPPEVTVEGDAALAGEVHWLIQNVRWDVEADLERVLGPLAAPPLVRLGSALAKALRTALAGAQRVGERLRPRPSA
jgi:ubiquinone biosynthesis protein UbiJ